jgi:hypothetical protein
MMNIITTYACALFDILLIIGSDSETLQITAIKMPLLLQTCRNGLLFNRHMIMLLTCPNLAHGQRIWKPKQQLKL